MLKLVKINHSIIALFSIGTVPLVANSASSLDNDSPQPICSSAQPWTTQSHLVRCKYMQ